MHVAVVGLGKMGAALAARLLAEGLTVTVWNRNLSSTAPLVAAGAEAVPRLALIWQVADVAMTFLADDDAVLDVYLSPGGLVESAPTGALLIEMSTISPAASEVVAAAARSRDLRYLRCPVSGNPAVLASGNITLIVSGDRAAVEEAKPLLEHVGPRLFYVGEKEQARVLKLAVNSMLAANAQMLAELVTLCEASGIERSVLLDVVGGSVIGSAFVKYKTGALLERRYDATFTTAMLVKDLQLTQQVAAGLSVPLPVTDLVTDLAISSCDEGLGDLDFLALLPHLQARAGRPSDVPVPLPGQDG
ncbi:MAG TPA: NAD(P)-dependent oxidoreductase [Acidimicrobiales bacterium]|nr:NAD(P)-dependent oxidoreductase [Acidimicrobiales bacterium]